MKIHELSQASKEKALGDYTNNFDFDFHAEYVKEDFKTQMELIGIEIDNIYYSGFWSQGDGAMFTGGYSYNKGWKQKLKEYSPLDTELFEIGNELQQIQRKYFYSVTTNITHSNSRYYHENTAVFDHSDEFYNSDDDVDKLEYELRNLMKVLYKRLEREYYYQTSMEAFEEFEAYEYEFDEEGNII